MELRRSSFLSSGAALAALAFLQGVPLVADSGTGLLELEPLVETLLPFGVPAFPRVTPAAVTEKMGAIFQISSSAVFQASLHGFSTLASFLVASDQLIAAERAMGTDADVTAALRSDAAVFASSGLSSTGTFRDMTPRQRNAYVSLWSHSSFSSRRRFYTSVRALTFIAFYSMPQSWPVIGYAGPFLPEARSS